MHTYIYFVMKYHLFFVGGCLLVVLGANSVFLIHPVVTYETLKDLIMPNKS